jgi:hypothetical protein
MINPRHRDVKGCKPVLVSFLPFFCLSPPCGLLSASISYLTQFPLEALSENFAFITYPPLLL